MEDEIVVTAIAKEAGKEGAQEAINAMLLTFGIEEDDHKEVRRDFEHLRRWRRSVEQAEKLYLQGDRYGDRRRVLGRGLAWREDLSGEVT